MDKARSGGLPFVFEDNMSFERCGGGARGRREVRVVRVVGQLSGLSGS